ncbi:MAG: branched-chain amino acid aminotransferase [Clostridiaceae bacterium]|nr:branched-chain amino acid aminotransferase [Clostridiaceae bacterium]
MYPAIPVTRTDKPKTRPQSEDSLGFGQIFTDHMFIMDYEEGKGWIDARIVPYGPIAMEPSAMVLHYGQAIFEGLKAYKSPEGETLLFRPRLNFERVNKSNARMVIPQVDPDFCVYALKELLRIDESWIPSAPDTSLYIRPFIIAMDPFLGVRPAYQYRFMIILSPSGAYYPQGLNPVDIYVEDEYVRAVKGGTGFAKTPGNYAASLIAQANAYKTGYVQVLWLDGVNRRYIEEVGSMNVFFVIDGKLITPALNGSILPGITRRTVLELAAALGYETEERQLAIDELADLYKQGRVSEVFGSGTAAVISPVGKLKYEDMIMEFNDGKIGEISQKMYDIITGVQFGRLEDKYGWIDKL